MSFRSSLMFLVHFQFLDSLVFLVEFFLHLLRQH